MQNFNLTFKGNDFWGRPTYQSEGGRYYKEVDGGIHTVADPTDFDGEPDSPLKLKEGYKLNIIKETMEVIDLSESLTSEKVAEYFEKANLTDSHPRLKAGQTIEFWAGQNNDIRYRSKIIGFDADQDIYVVWDCYWFPIKDNEARNIVIIEQ